MLEILIASGCMMINGVQYCPTNGQPTQPNTIIEQPNVIIEEVVEIDTPIYQLKTESMTDPRYAQMYFDYQSVKVQNDCTESLLLVLEDREQHGDDTCATRVQEIFGDEFGTNPTVTENIFRMQAHYTRSVLKLQFKLPLGLDRRLQAATGLSAEQ